MLAARTYLTDRVLGALLPNFVAGREATARRRESQRILNELHDNAKQSLRGTSMLIAACIEAQKSGKVEKGHDLLARALEMSQDAGRQMCEPFEGIGIYPRRIGTGAASIKQKFRKLCADFGVEAHEDLQGGLEVLSGRNFVTADKICTEAFWNAVKHSGARTLRLESRLAGRVLVLRVSDDGSGFSRDSTSQGLGMGLMRLRAEEAGASLNVSSTLGAGTSVELRLIT